MNHEQFSKEVRSQKVTLAVIRAKQRLKNFTYVSGDTWIRKTNYVVSNVSGAPFEFDLTTSILTITSSVNPNTLNIIAEYSLFFSDFPVNEDVEYQARLQDIGALKLELDTENTGVAIESDSSIKLENTDGYFDEIYDTLIWENQLCEFYSWSPLIAWSERKLIYQGYINTKAFSKDAVSFTLKDTFVKLRETIPFTGTRLIYGKAKNLDTSPLDLVGEGFALSSVVSGLNDRDLLTGSFSGTAGGNTISGVGSLLLSQIAVGDKIRIIDGILEYSYTVNAIPSNTSLTISGTISVSFSGSQGRNASKLNNIITGFLFLDEVSPDDELTILGEKYKVKSIESDSSLTITDQIKTAFTNVPAINSPDINYRMKNRSWNVSGHKLASHLTTIDTVLSQSVFSVVDIGHIQFGDLINIADNYYSVDRVSGKTIFLNQVSLTTLTSGETVLKPSIQKVSVDNQVFIPGRDYSEVNSDDGCAIIFNNEAEFNIATDSLSGVSLVFTVGSRIVTALTSTLDLTTILSPRDWIKAFTGTINYFEILSVEPTQLTLRHAYNETRPFTGPALYRRPVYIGDDSAVLVDCMGKKAGNWLKNASDAVKDLCDQIGFTNYNLASFAEAALDADYTMSLVYPKSIGSAMPIARDAISEINTSVFGSLFSDNNFRISYSVLNADRDENIELIEDSDIISFSTLTKNQIVGKVTVNYRHEHGLSSFSTYSYENENVPGIKTELKLDLCLYEEDDAITIAQRYAFYRSLSQTVVKIKAKLNLIYKALNDRVYLSLERLFKRFGAKGNIKIGLVNMISKDNSSIELQVNDLGNVFSRVGSIAPDDANDYEFASDEEISRYGYIVDDDAETAETSSDISIGTNLIG